MTILKVMQIKACLKHNPFYIKKRSSISLNLHLPWNPALLLAYCKQTLPKNLLIISVEDRRDEINALFLCWSYRKVVNEDYSTDFLFALGRQKHLMKLYICVRNVFWKSKWYLLKLTSHGACKLQLWELNLWAQAVSRGVSLKCDGGISMQVDFTACS